MSKFKWEKILNKKRIRDYKINKKSSDCRDEFENDYDRILFSASFRRLQDKAQVFPLEKLDFVRTRLTHSLEVSSIGKSLGISIGSRLVKKTINYEEKVTISMVEDISNILACAGLIHDLGNPPFGHFGEVAIREWFKNKLCKNEDGSYNFKYDKYDFNLDKQEALDLLNFEGNAQGLRILTKLHFVIDRYGMNLTTGVLSAIIKYPISSLDKENSNLKKIGYYKAEEKIFKEIAEDTDIWKCRNPLVYILEAADDIAYLLGDLEDAFNKKIITHDIFKMKYEEFINSYDEIMDGVYEGDLISNSKANKISLFLRSISKEYVYTNEKIVANEIVGYNIIHNLLDIFVPAALNKEVKPYKGYDGKLYSLISKNYRFVCENNIEQKECSEEYSRLLLVTDFICGMTDSYAAYLYEEINGMKA